jgi:hypothetical protein
MSSLKYSWILCLALGCAAESDKPVEPVAVLDAGPSFPVQRKVLHEVFSASNCGPCLEAEERLGAVWDAHADQYTIVDYQVGSDRYITQEAVARRYYYLPEGAESYSIPWVVTDGVNSFHPNLWHADAGTEADHYNADDFASFVSQEANLIIDVTHEVEGQTITIDWSITAGADYASEDLVVHVAVNEKVTSQNVGTNGLTEFHHVMKKMLPNKQGSRLGSVQAGDMISDTYVYEFQGDYDPDTGLPRGGDNPKHYVDHRMAHTVEEFDDLEVVVWVQDVETKEVHQSEWSQ